VRWPWVVQRFGAGSSERDVEGRELVQFIEWARRAGVRRLVLDGSFVTAKVEPNDVDLVILPGPDYPRDQPPANAEEVLWPFLHILVAADDDDLGQWILQDFGTDRDLRPKGSSR
jgi:hypothetical protein